MLIHQYAVADDHTLFCATEPGFSGGAHLAYTWTYTGDERLLTMFRRRVDARFPILLRDKLLGALVPARMPNIVEGPISHQSLG